MMKLEYVKQKYQDYPLANILHGGVFEGTMITASSRSDAPRSKDRK